MTASCELRHLLPWYLTGRLDPGEHEKVQTHLRVCPDCLEEARAFASMKEALESSVRGAHVPADELLPYASGRSPMSLARREAITGHLETCAACRADLETLKQAGARPGSRAPEGRRRWPPAIAAGFALLLVGGALWWFWRPAADVVTLLPQERGEPSSTLLTGSGPWRVTAVLPYEAPEGGYTARVESDERPGADLMTLNAPSLRDGTVEILLPPLPAPGAYRLLLTPLRAATEIRYVYSFEVAPVAGAERRKPVPR